MNLWDHTADELVGMPTDALALLILADFAPNGWNVDSYFREAESNHQAIYSAQGVAEAMSDAWSWLEGAALVGHHPTQSSPNARRVTKAGLQALAEGLGYLRAGQRLAIDLHPSIAQQARRQFLMGEFELAAFAALRQVEIRVRALGGFAEDRIGVNLMAAAFKLTPPGPLVDQTAEPGEQEATMALFRGAIGTFKNPSSHRAVDYSDPTLAAEIIMLGDLLLRLLDRIEARIAADQRQRQLADIVKALKASSIGNDEGASVDAPIEPL